MQRYLFPGVIITSVALVVLLGVGYMMGYRLGPGITLVKTHTLTITDLPVNATVFTDYTSRGTTATSTMTANLIPGTHTLLASATGYWPWSTIVTVPDNKNVVANAFLVPKITNGTLLSGSAAQAARTLVAHQTLPTAAHPLLMADGCALVSVTDINQIVAVPTTTPSCTPPPYLCIGGTCATTVILSPVAQPTAVVPYPGRQDALLIGIDKTIYALSLDPRSPRTFAPILRGIAPRIAVQPDGTVVVVDQSTVYQLTL
ncbi:MAG: hypothetical protein B7X04_03610 [Parcubacteria group bacterium 21-54-25]|nr:MAG: hypothetical protein B7X04_03610 [Parcubacteria group bacterium 21-54-25]HQU08073.1 hypothetical protein [Candidatus Paceibacterota bacterium]